ncbi:ATP synthase subunit b [Candidatus Saccharibacteria bacterium RAAC3_TM7_1]|nr:ATP synthase subunit b [Candidatus Saccharibacteria bacterium RAAC3_TM7_1]HCZ28604.1 ATP synthase F0 subunit B [Candidatus Saccharibacteria bacterium]
MTELLTQFASAEAGSGNLFSALGIDWQMLIFQSIAFVILVFLLGKFVFPILMKSVDEHQAKIEESIKAADEAAKQAREAEEKIEATLKKARGEAADIVSIAKTEATQMIEKAEDHAKGRAERIVAKAQEELQKDVLAARKTLEKDTIAFVKKAASLAVSSVADDRLDTAIVKKSIEEARRS